MSDADTMQTAAMGQSVVASPAEATSFHNRVSSHPKEGMKPYLHFKSLSVAAGAKLSVPPRAPGASIGHHEDRLVFPCLRALEAAGAQQAEDGQDEQLHCGEPGWCSLCGGDGSGEFMSQENGWESLGSVNKLHGEGWLLLCTAPVDCLSLGGGATLARQKGRTTVCWLGGLLCWDPSLRRCCGFEESSGKAARRVLESTS